MRKKAQSGRKKTFETELSKYSKPITKTVQSYPFYKYCCDNILIKLFFYTCNKTTKPGLENSNILS